MKIFNSKRLAYFDELGEDPEVQKALGPDEELVAKVVGLKNYTPEVLQILRDRFDAGRATSYPVKTSNGYIFWIKDPKDEEGVIRQNSTMIEKVERPNDLPASEFGIWQDYVMNGQRYVPKKQAKPFNPFAAYRKP